MYADDLLIMCRVKPQEAEVVNAYFKKYYEWFGQQANMEKSSIVFSKNSSRRDKKFIKEILGFKEMGSNSVYLGNSLIMGKNKPKDFFKLKDRVRDRLDGWNKQLLSKVGKVTLLKSVVQAIPIYSMETFKIPRGIYDELDALVRKFWWKTKPNSSGFLTLKAWNEICKSKEFGGFGIRRFRDFNSAPLAKLVWNVALGMDKLWTRMLFAKYLKGKSFFECKQMKGASWI